jgi:hypothetical protein
MHVGLNFVSKILIICRKNCKNGDFHVKQLLGRRAVTRVARVNGAVPSVFLPPPAVLTCHSCVLVRGSRLYLLT